MTADSSLFVDCGSSSTEDTIDCGSATGCNVRDAVEEVSPDFGRPRRLTGVSKSCEFSAATNGAPDPVAGMAVVALGGTEEGEEVGTDDPGAVVTLAETSAIAARACVGGGGGRSTGPSIGL